MPQNDLEELAVLVMDMRATVESMRRSIANAQGSIEHFRHTRGQEPLADIADCLGHLAEETIAVTEAVAEAQKPLSRLREVSGESSPPSAG